MIICMRRCEDLQMRRGKRDRNEYIPYLYIDNYFFLGNIMQNESILCISISYFIVYLVLCSWMYVNVCTSIYLSLCLFYGFRFHISQNLSGWSSTASRRSAVESRPSRELSRTATVASRISWRGTDWARDSGILVGLGLSLVAVGVATAVGAAFGPWDDGFFPASLVAMEA